MPHGPSQIQVARAVADNARRLLDGLFRQGVHASSQIELSRRTLRHSRELLASSRPNSTTGEIRVKPLEF